MKKVTLTCDICGSEQGVLEHATLPVYRKFDSTDGRTFFNPPVIEFRTMDICECCLRRATNIYDKTVQGYGEIIITPNPTLEEDRL